MKSAVALAFSLSVAASLSASAQPSSKNGPSPSSKATAVGGVETIKPQEQTSKDVGGVSGWNGSYVGVNAGMGFGATAGTNLVVPFGTRGKTEE